MNATKDTYCMDMTLQSVHPMQGQFAILRPHLRPDLKVSFIDIQSVMGYIVPRFI